MDEKTQLLNFFESFLRSGGTVTFTEFSNFSSIEQESFLTAGLLVEVLKLKQLEWIITESTTLDKVASRTLSFSNRITKSKMDVKKVK